jgi:hypothetical protein
LPLIFHWTQSRSGLVIAVMSDSLSCPSACRPHESSMRPSPHRLILITTCHLSAHITASLDLDSFEKSDHMDTSQVALVCPQQFLQPLLSWRKVERKHDAASISGPFTRAKRAEVNTHRKCYNCVNRRVLLPPRAIKREDRSRPALLFETQRV